MSENTSQWPVLKRYMQNRLLRIAMPLGGIGTGTVSIGGRGDLRDWEVGNRPSKGYTPAHTFFALWAKRNGAPAVTLALEGPIHPAYYEGASGATAPNHGLPRFRRCQFHAAYPLAQVLLSDPDVPLSVRIEAFNPLIPGDADASGIPLAVLRFVLTNHAAGPVEAAVCACMENFIGCDAKTKSAGKNVNESRSADGLRGVFMRSDGVRPKAEQHGTMALVTTSSGKTTHRTAWAKLGWGDSLADFWTDFAADGRLDPRDHHPDVNWPTASLAVRLRVPPRAVRQVTFLIAWHYPNRYTWSPIKPGDGGSDDANWIGNYYTTVYRDAWDVAVRSARDLAALQRRTVQFVDAFCRSDLPIAAKEAALFNLSALRSQTCFRTPDGFFFGWEGCGDANGCCHGSCTHVWNYEQATAFLFGDLAWKMRRIEFAHATDETGRMAFRVNLPLDRAREFAFAAADGQLGCIIKLYRDWQLRGDEQGLRELWPNARRALEFCWLAGGWDADRDGVMEGCQHNTMDVEYFGPNPQISVMYLAALRAAERIAAHLGQTDFAGDCRELFQRGSRWIDHNLFNGEYYHQIIRPIADPSSIHGALRMTMGAESTGQPAYQIGPGCEVNQLFGQQLAHVAGLGHLLDEGKVRAALRGLMKHNFRKDLSRHFNRLRSYALNDEGGLLMCTWPRGPQPPRPFPYGDEVWTGTEYMVAAHLIAEGMVADGLKIIATARARHDGARRNPFNEPECGHHYARAMSSWAAILALTGFHYSAVDQSIEFAPTRRTSEVFWSTGYAWGACRQKPTRGSVAVRISVLWGELPLRTLRLTGVGQAHLKKPIRLIAGRAANAVIARAARQDSQ